MVNNADYVPVYVPTLLLYTPCNTPFVSIVTFLNEEPDCISTFQDCPEWASRSSMYCGIDPAPVTLNLMRSFTLLSRVLPWTA